MDRRKSTSLNICQLNGQKINAWFFKAIGGCCCRSCTCVCFVEKTSNLESSYLSSRICLQPHFLLLDVKGLRWLEERHARGWGLSVEWGGSESMTISFSLAKSMAARDFVWDECPSMMMRTGLSADGFMWFLKWLSQVRKMSLSIQSDSLFVTGWEKVHHQQVHSMASFF